MANFTVESGINVRQEDYTVNAAGFRQFFHRRVDSKINEEPILKSFKFIFNKLRKATRKIRFYENYKVKLSPDLKVRLKSISLPSVETSLIPIVENLYDQFKNRLPKRLSINYNSILQQDRDVLTEFIKPKNFKIAEIGKLIKAVKIFSKILRVDLFVKEIGVNYEMSDDEVFSELPSDTSSCFPLFTKKSDSNSKLEAQGTFQKFMESSTVSEVYSKMVKLPSVVFHRFSNKLEYMMDRFSLKTKIRLIFGVPFSIIFSETKVFGKLQRFIQSRKTCISIGINREEVANRVNFLRMKAQKESDSVVVGLDISGMDKRLSSFWILLFFSWLFFVIPFSSVHATLVVGLACYHIYSPVLSSRLDLIITEGGNLSGSRITTILNSFTLSISIILYYLIYEDRDIMGDEFHVLGDDAVLIMKKGGFNNLKMLFKNLGLTINEGKTKISDPFHESIHFLGFEWTVFGEPSNSHLWWISRIIYPEKYVEERGHGRLILRICSICFQLNYGAKVATKLLKALGYNIDELLRQDPEIYYLDRRRRTQLGVIPFSKLYRYRWTCF